LTFLLSLLALNFICFEYTRSYFDEYLNFFFFLSISSFNVLGIILAGWTSNSKYTILGSLRAAAQVFSFEMCFITLLLPIFLINSTFNLIDIVIYQNHYWNIFFFLPTGIFFFIILLAETNRTPFDLPEAEAELVAGYNLEYSSINFALFFLGEYTNMLLNSAIFVIFFLGGWTKINLFSVNIYSFTFLVVLTYFISLLRESNILKSMISLISILIMLIISFNHPVLFFIIKTIIVSCFFIIVRAILPRYRFDQLMDLCWKKILPMACAFLLFFIFNIYYFDAFLYNLEIFYLKPKFLIINYFKIL
jgi:NADH-quinone oxidoreductase subunit H